MAKRFVLALTGATGAAFGVAVLKRLVAHAAVDHVELLLSPTGRWCLVEECGQDAEALARLSPKVHVGSERNLGADIASGSYRHDGMAIVPCSAGTLGRIAAGTSDNLITRAADVCLKERFPLVLCLRETPLNRIHLENMLRVHDAGAVVMPLAPGYYQRPADLLELADSFAVRVLDQLGLDQADVPRWGDPR